MIVFSLSQIKKYNITLPVTHYFILNDKTG